MTSLEDIAQVALAEKKAQFSLVDLGNGRVDDHFGCTVHTGISTPKSTSSSPEKKC